MPQSAIPTDPRRLGRRPDQAHGGADVHRERETRGGGRLEHRAPVPGGERRQPERVRVLDEQHRARALGGTTLDLGDCRGYVPQRDERLRDEPIRIGRAPLVDHPVVPRADHRERELRVLRLEELRAAEAGERREQKLGGHTIVVHRPDPLVHVVGRRDHVLVSPGEEVLATARLALPEPARLRVPLEREWVEAVLPEPPLDSVTIHDVGARSRNLGSICAVKTCAGSMTWSSTEISWTSSRSIEPPSSAESVAPGPDHAG